MAVGSTTAAVIGAIAAVSSAAVGVVTNIEQTNVKKAQAEYSADMAEYNAKVAEGNAQIAEEAGRQAKKEADENATRKRQETALLIGKQRATQAASGAQVGVGSSLDANLDIAERGELDALQLEEQGKWQNYNKKIDAWGARNQGAALQSQASMYSNQANSYSPLLENSKTLLSAGNKTTNQFIKMI